MSISSNTNTDFHTLTNVTESNFFAIGMFKDGQFYVQLHEEAFSMTFTEQIVIANDILYQSIVNNTELLTSLNVTTNDLVLIKSGGTPANLVWNFTDQIGLLILNTR
ncbi:hypothetical protein EJF36_19655 [Bacillus sp. HMF5848]|uniref:hypothetical protein n=1 Tax=Bacillus sp. HMF5848 TaxID=2495421 RepID=UPI000F78930D|nr:hypothetical protein [Bacillus sp. HMF5848]RSK28914.1 hypothetical protein EJF36_19655 [Bacillus sp. HMF5848]